MFIYIQYGYGYMYKNVVIQLKNIVIILETLRHDTLNVF